MVDVAKMKLFGMDMGTFRWDESYNVARFEYDKNFADKGIEPDQKGSACMRSGKQHQERIGDYRSGLR